MVNKKILNWGCFCRYGFMSQFIEGIEPIYIEYLVHARTAQKLWKHQNNEYKPEFIYWDGHNQINIRVLIHLIDLTKVGEIVRG